MGVQRSVPRWSRLRPWSSRAAPSFPRTRAIAAVLKAAFANPALRRVGFAGFLFGTAELSIWIALLIFAYQHGGTRAGTAMVLVQLVPCMVLGPVLGSYGDRRPPQRVLSAGYALQVFAMVAVAGAILLRAPAVVVFVLAPLTALSFTVTRPAQAALFPLVVRTPDELTAANVMTGWTFGAASLLGPALAGVLIGWRGTGLAVVGTSALSAGALILVSGLKGVAITPNTGSNVPTTRILHTSVSDLGAGLGANLAALRENPALRILLSLHAFYYVIVGAVDLLCVVLAASYLHMGQGGAGYLNGSFGAGALLAGFVTAFLLGRHRLKNTLVFSLFAAVAALALIGTSRVLALVLALMAAVGLAGNVFDVTGRTLLQRSCPPDATAGLFSFLEALMDFGLALGAVLVQVMIGLGGIYAALVAPAALAALLAVLLWGRLRRLDAAAVVPQVEIRLLRTISIFAVLPAPTLETIARELEPVSVPRGTTIFREGDAGDRYYAVASGSLAVARRGHLVDTLTRGQGFGEIALIRDVPRSATVTAMTDASLYSLRKDLFVQTVTGHAGAAKVTGQVIAGHLGEGRGPPDSAPRAAHG